MNSLAIIRSARFIAPLALCCATVACGGGSSGGGNGIPSLPNQVGDTRNDGPFVFNNAPPERFAQIDRMGIPVVASVLIRNAPVDGENQRDRFNETDPRTDGDFAGDIVPTVDRLHRELDDDLCALNFTPCSRRDGPDGLPTDVCSAPDGPNFSITNCAVQAVPQIVPDVLTYNLNQPDGFPNGRRLEDSVVDRFLVPALLDVNEQGDCNGEPCNLNSFENLPLNPPVNELAFSSDFPFLPAPHATERE